MPDRWWDDALCAQTDPEAFHPDKGRSAAAAKRICSSCDVREKCLEWALTLSAREDAGAGVLGGLSPRERLSLRRNAA